VRQDVLESQILNLGNNICDPNVTQLPDFSLHVLDWVRGRTFGCVCSACPPFFVVFLGSRITCRNLSFKNHVLNTARIVCIQQFQLTQRLHLVYLVGNRVHVRTQQVVNLAIQQSHSLLDHIVRLQHLRVHQITNLLFIPFQPCGKCRDCAGQFFKAFSRASLYF